MTSLTSDDQQALAHLRAPLGEPGSGRQRYAAAMYFNRSGRMSDAALEVYRICSPKDGEDPAALLAARGLRVDLPLAAPLAGEQAILDLVEAADRYLASLSGPGIAETRAGLAAWRSGPVRVARAPANPTVERWMAAAIEQLSATHTTLAAAIAAAVPHLSWITYDGYPLNEVGEAFARGHAYCTIVGEDAAIPAVDWDLGLFLIAPDVLYRDHNHQAPELYAPLTGPHGWRFGVDQPMTILPAHRPVWNDPFAPHMTKVGPVPFLCMYSWTKDVNAVARIIPASDWSTLERLRLAG